MAEYQLTNTNSVIRTSDGATIPNDDGNRDWVEYQDWLSGGGVPDPYVEPPPPPPVIDANARLDAGITAAVATAIAARDAIHNIPSNGAIPARFDALLIQMKVTTDAFVAMLQAQIPAQGDPP